jgi:hypothetical protein
VPFATIVRAGFLEDVAIIDELLQDAGQGLLGNAKDFKEIGNSQAGVAGNEVDNTVVSAAVAEIPEEFIGVAGKITVREEKQLDDLEHLRRRGGRGRGGHGGRSDGQLIACTVVVGAFGPGFRIYVSHVDLLGCD